MFTGGSGDDAKGIAEALSHEVGHNMGLHHDGTSSQGYYEGTPTGRRSWRRVLPAGDPVSHGEYANANNPGEDDVAVIGIPPASARRGRRHGRGGRPLPTGTASSPRTDLDLYQVGHRSGAVTVAASPAPTSPDLDIALTLLDTAGSTVAPPTRCRLAPPTTSPPARGHHQHHGWLGSVPRARRRVGTGSPVTGYNDYGSPALAHLAVTGCSGSTAPRS